MPALLFLYSVLKVIVLYSQLSDITKELKTRMSTNKTTPTHEDATPKNYNWIDHMQPPTHLKSQVQPPLSILDIRYGKTKDSFEFVVSIKNSYGNRSPDVSIDTLDEVTLEYRHWLLSKFKMNLRGLGLIDRLKSWVLDRLSLLKMYCDIHGTSFEGLYVASALPPHQTSKIGSSNTEDMKNDRVDSQNRSKTIKKKMSISVNEKKSQHAHRFVQSKGARVKAVYNHLKILLAKYNNRQSIDKETFLQELDCMNAYLYDL